MKTIHVALLFASVSGFVWSQDTATVQRFGVSDILFLVVAVILAIYIIIREIYLKASRDSICLQLSRLEQSVKDETDEKNKLLGENKQLVGQSADAKAKLESTQGQLGKVQESITKFESEREERTREQERNVRELENARKALADEQARVRKEEEERRKQEVEERDRVWAVHEQEAIAKMKEICQKPALGFAFFDANNLPEGFDTSVKPDFMVDFLGQYIIFDPKISKSANLASYIKSQVKSTANKCRNTTSTELIYKTVFFVVPTIELPTLKEFTFFEQGYTFHVIPTEAFEPILSAYQRISDYDLAERFNPQEREDIINLIALLSQHVRHQNATNVLNTILGVKALQECEALPDDISSSVEDRRKTMREPGFKPSDIKRLINSPEEQMRELARLAAPSRPPVSQDDLKEAHESTLAD